MRTDHPLADEDDAFWWDALHRDELLVTTCGDCGRSWIRAMPGCPYCAGTTHEVAPSSGRGVVYSWIVAHWAFDPRFADDIPYTVLTVDLEEGARMHGRLVEGDPDELEAGLPVEAVLYDADGRRLVGFRPAR
jgi:uncharacterized protein